MRARVTLIALVVVACGHKPSELDKERAKATSLCKGGDGQQCMIAAAGLDGTNKNQLRTAMGLWTRGCELGSGPCCAQLGTVAEFGMTSGGAKPDMMTAQMYYERACKLGDKRTCKQIGVPLPREEDPDYKPFDWKEALFPICGKGHGEMGPLFDGLVLGQPMPEAMKQAVAAFEKKYQAHVHYYPGDPTILSGWDLEVRFDEKESIDKTLVAGWGQPDLPFGAWTSETKHTIAYRMYPSDGSGINWTSYRSIDEVILPDDKTRLGIEPIPMIGAKLVDVQAAIGARMLRTAEDGYRYMEDAAGPAVDVHIIEKRGVIIELYTMNWITNSPQVGQALFDALQKKWGTPKIDKAGVHTWKPPGRLVRASMPATGNFELTITRR